MNHNLWLTGVYFASNVKFFIFNSSDIFASDACSKIFIPAPCWVFLDTFYFFWSFWSETIGTSKSTCITTTIETIWTYIRNSIGINGNTVFPFAMCACRQKTLISQNIE